MTPTVTLEQGRKRLSWRPSQQQLLWHHVLVGKNWVQCMMNKVRWQRILAVGWIALVMGACSTADSERMVDMPLSDEPLVGKFVWHDLITDDVEGARAFYGGLFGWTFEKSLHPNGGDYTLILAGERYLGGMVELDDPQGVEYSRWLGYLSVADVDRAAAFTRREGGEVVVEPLELGQLGRAAAIRDPQGAVVGLVRSRLGDPADAIPRGVGEIVWNELLAADDLSAAGFYSGLAGLEVVDQPRAGGVYRVMRSQGRERSGIMLRPGEQVDPVWLTHFAVSDVTAAAGRAAELGGELLLGPSPELRAGRMALVMDPAGAVLLLSQVER